MQAATSEKVWWWGQRTGPETRASGGCCSSASVTTTYSEKAEQRSAECCLSIYPQGLHTHHQITKKSSPRLVEVTDTSSSACDHGGEAARLCSLQRYLR